MENIFNPQYLFSTFPGSPNLLFWKFVIVYAVLALIIAIVAHIYQRKNVKDGIKRKLWYKWSVWGYFVGPIALLLAFFRLQNAYFLSMRALIFTWLFVSLLWLLWIVRHWVIKVPKKIQARDERNKMEQYLPHKK